MKDYRKELKKLSTEKHLDVIHDELESIGDQLEAHRLVLAWLLSEMPNNEGEKYLSRQANILEDGKKQSTMSSIVAELDELREQVVFYRVSSSS